MTDYPDRGPVVLIYEDVTGNTPTALGEIRWIPGEQPTGTTPSTRRLIERRIEQHNGDVVEAMTSLVGWSNGVVRTRLSPKGST